MTGAARVAFGALGFLAAVTGCKDDPVGCDDDGSCPLAHACVYGECVPRLADVRPSWSLEVRGAAKLPPREFPQWPLASGPVNLILDPGVMAQVLLTGPPPATAAEPTELPALLAIPSAIPGRRELMFEAVGRPVGAPPPYDLTWLLPSDALGRAAEIRLVPGTQIQRHMPPWRLPWLVAGNGSLALPGPEDALVITGTLEGIGPGPPTRVEARVVSGSRTLSNVVTVTGGERFELRTQKSVAEALGSLEVVLTPAEGQPPQAELSIPVTPGATDLGTLRPPPLPPVTSVIVPVVQTAAGGSPDLPVASATVVVSTTLEATPPVVASYTRASQTDSAGRATFSLFPGSGNATRKYEVLILPPAASSAGALCIPDYPVAATVSDTPRVGATIRLPRRAAVAGRVLRADGRPAVSVRVRATRQGTLFGADCGGGSASSLAEVTTDGGGAFALWVDPGVYRFDYEPPVGSALPQHREQDVAVTTDLERDVILPRPAAVEGVVTAVDGMPVGMAEIRAFYLDASGQAQVEGKTLSGRDGSFRMVLPQKP